ncbi:MAG: hypothetical protein OEV94_08790 [Deltaproteobacteria bacterium]|nr:hypothetical protein [Deltaproteobacteria bacterium]
MKANKEDYAKLLAEVEKLAAEGKSQKEIAKEMGIKTTQTLTSRLLKASQVTGRPVPPFRGERGGARKARVVNHVEVRRRGKGDAYGVNVPQEPLERAGIKPGDRLRLTIRGRSISLTKGEEGGEENAG